MAFVGGVLSLLSPCSALLLPAFFAYAFPSRGQLLLRTLVFYLGLITLLVPIGLGIGALGSLFLERRAELSLIAGLLLIGIGAYQLAIGGFELPGASRLQGRSFGVSGESLATTYVLGLVYAPDYAQLGGPALAALALGNVAFSVFAIAGTILNGAAYTRSAIISAGITLVVAVIADYIAISMTAGTEYVLAAAAAATGGAMVFKPCEHGVQRALKKNKYFRQNAIDPGRVERRNH